MQNIIYNKVVITMMSGGSAAKLHQLNESYDFGGKVFLLVDYLQLICATKI